MEQNPRDKYLIPTDKSSNMGEQIWGTLYPNWNTSKSRLQDIRRAIAPMNPFAMQQIPTQERQGFGVKAGNQFWRPDPYPNAIHFTKMFPTHYDPLKEMRRGETSIFIQDYAPDTYSNYSLKIQETPRGCQAEQDKFKRCVMINGGEGCDQEKNNFMQVCPNWILDGMKQSQRFLVKVQLLANTRYRDCMEVSSYNKGRTVADVSNKDFIDGTKKYLRPDTMWADERYSQITQKEINEAKERLAARKAAKGETEQKKEETYVADPSGRAYVHVKPIYP